MSRGFLFVIGTMCAIAGGSLIGLGECVGLGWFLILWTAITPLLTEGR